MKSLSSSGLMIKVIAIGKKHEPWVEGGIRRYSERLRPPWNIDWVVLPHSTVKGQAALQEESGRIVQRLKASDYVILLDERGTPLHSPALSAKLQGIFTASQSVVIVIGGAFGVDATVAARADFTWSLSPLVFPHQLVRLILAEQLYRCQEIAAGHPYHHE